MLLKIVASKLYSLYKKYGGKNPWYEAWRRSIKQLSGFKTAFLLPYFPGYGKIYSIQGIKRRQKHASKLYFRFWQCTDGV